MSCAHKPFRGTRQTNEEKVQNSKRMLRITNHHEYADSRNKFEVPNLLPMWRIEAEILIYIMSLALHISSRDAVHVTFLDPNKNHI